MERGELRTILGKSVTDVYGRPLGRVIGVTLDLKGEISTIGVETGRGFVELSRERFVSVDKEITIQLEWAAAAGRPAFEKAVFERRMASLERMKSMKGFSEKAYEAQIARLRQFKDPETHEEASAMMKTRLEELGSIDQAIDNFVSAVRLQFLTQELDEELLNFTTESCSAIRGINSRERSDISEMLGSVFGNGPPKEAEVATSDRQETPSPIEEPQPTPRPSLVEDIPSSAVELAVARPPPLEEDHSAPTDIDPVVPAKQETADPDLDAGPRSSTSLRSLQRRRN